VVLKLVWLLQTLLTLQATRDALTGIPNRRNFMDIASREIHRAQRYGHPLSLAVVDLDLFKRINDAHGHHTGDLVLQAFCRTCRNTLRDSDVIGRIGGEEFAILLPNTSQTEAQEVIERVRRAVAATLIPITGPAPLCFTASFGISTLHQGSGDLGNLLRRADGALYQAKERGRNQVFLSPA
jgi:diguanylate cyclase (GGDEF)-like protein